MINATSVLDFDQASCSNAETLLERFRIYKNDLVFFNIGQRGTREMAETRRSLAALPDD